MVFASIIQRPLCRCEAFDFHVCHHRSLRHLFTERVVRKSVAERTLVIEVKSMNGSRSGGARRLALPDSRTHASHSSSWSNAGALAAAAWFRGRGLIPTGIIRWSVEIALDVIDAPAPEEYDETTATRFHLDIYSEEWGVYFCHGGRASWIRVTDIAFVHGRDDYGLLGITPSLKDIGMLLRRLENQFRIKLRRDHALVQTNLSNALPVVRSWLATL